MTVTATRTTPVFLYGATGMLGGELLRLLERAPFRLIGVGITDLTPMDATPQPAPDLFAPDDEISTKAETATDKIRARFGKDAIIRGRALR